METISVGSKSRNEWIDITGQIQKAVDKAGIQNGFCLIFVPHTTAAITINEGADPSVTTDILNHLSRQIPHNAGYKHLEGNADAHIKSVLVGASESVIIQKGRLVLGTWQSIFFCEFDGPRNRKVLLHFSQQQ